MVNVTMRASLQEQFLADQAPTSSSLTSRVGAAKLGTGKLELWFITDYAETITASCRPLLKRLSSSLRPAGTPS